MKPNEYLHEAADLFEEVGKIYGDNYKRMGLVMKGLFPEGVDLRTLDDHNRFHLLQLAIVKLTRYCENWSKGGHDDSLKDLAVYSMMLLEIDTEIKNGAKLPFDTATGGSTTKLGPKAPLGRHSEKGFGEKIVSTVEDKP